MRDGVIVGISDHGGWAVFVAVGRDGRILDRRRVELVSDDLPAIPHHHEAQMLPIDEGVALVERVRASAEKYASVALTTMASAIPGIAGIAMRTRQALPPTIEERIKDVRARNVADWVMYRNALALAAEQRGWTVHWHDKNAIESLKVPDRKAVGTPWNADHKLATALALASLE